MKQQGALPLVWPDRYDLEHYIVAECNQLAFDAVCHPDKWQMPVMILLGSSTSGKTHLAQVFRELHHALWIDDEAGLTTALTQDNGFVVIDDVDQTIVSDESLFHLINAVTARNGRLLLTTSALPSQWAQLPDLRSRLQAANHLTLEQPSEEMVKAAYQKLFTDRGLLVDDKVVDFLSLRSERSFSGIRAIVDRLDQASLERSRRITIPLIQELDLF